MSVAISPGGSRGGCLAPTARVVFVGLFLATCATAQSPVPNTPQGFQQQYRPAFEAYERHDNTGLEKLHDTFTSPAPWFSQTFGPDRGRGLARRYASEFLDFKLRTASHFAGIDSLKARLQLDPSTPTDVRTRPWTAAESTSTWQGMPALHAPLPPVEKFEMDYVLAAPGQSARLTSWIDSFVYIDGAFRFFSYGSRSSWNPYGSNPRP